MINTKKIKKTLSFVFITLLLIMLCLTFSACSLFDHNKNMQTNNKIAFQNAISATINEIEKNLADPSGNNAMNTKTITTNLFNQKDLEQFNLSNNKFLFLKNVLSRNKIILSFYTKVLQKTEFEISNLNIPFIIDTTDSNLFSKFSMQLKKNNDKYEIYFFNAEDFVTPNRYNLVKFIIDYNNDTQTLNNFELFLTTKKNDNNTAQTNNIYLSHAYNSKYYITLKNNTIYNEFNLLLSNYTKNQLSNTSYILTNEIKSLQTPVAETFTKEEIQNAISTTAKEIEKNLADPSGNASSNENIFLTNMFNANNLKSSVLMNNSYHNTNALNEHKNILNFYSEVLKNSKFTLTNLNIPFTLNIQDINTLDKFSMQLIKYNNKYRIYFFNADNLTLPIQYNLIKFIIDYDNDTHNLNGFEIFSSIKKNGSNPNTSVRTNSYISHMYDSKYYTELKYSVNDNIIFENLKNNYLQNKSINTTYNFTNEMNAIPKPAVKPVTKVEIQNAISVTAKEIEKNLADLAGNDSLNEDILVTNIFDKKDLTSSTLSDYKISFLKNLLTQDKIILDFYFKVLGNNEFKLNDLNIPFIIDTTDSNLFSKFSMQLKKNNGKYEIYFFNAEDLKTPNKYNLIKFIIDYNNDTQTLISFEIFSSCIKISGNPNTLPTTYSNYLSHICNSKYYTTTEEYTNNINPFQNMLLNYTQNQMSETTYNFTNEMKIATKTNSEQTKKETFKNAISATVHEINKNLADPSGNNSSNENALLNNTFNKKDLTSLPLSDSTFSSLKNQLKVNKTLLNFYSEILKNSKFKLTNDNTTFCCDTTIPDIMLYSITYFRFKNINNKYEIYYYNGSDSQNPKLYNLFKFTIDYNNETKILNNFEVFISMKNENSKSINNYYISHIFNSKYYTILNNNQKYDNTFSEILNKFLNNAVDDQQYDFTREIDAAQTNN